MNENIWPLILLGGGLLAFLLVVSFLSKCLPSDNKMTTEEQDQIIEIIKSCFK